MAHQNHPARPRARLGDGSSEILLAKSQLNGQDSQGYSQPALLDSQSHDALAVWFEEWSTPILLLEADGFVTAANAQARQLLEAGTDFRLTEGRVAFHNRIYAAAFRNFLESLAEQPKIWSLPHSSDSGFWILRAQKLNPRPETALIGLMLNCTAEPNQKIWANLSTPFGLTRSEDRVARRLFDGFSAAEISEEMAISVETARTYIRRIYTKTGASNREKLLTILAPFQSMQ